MQEDIRDLLSKDQNKRLEVKERPDTGVYVKDLSSFVTKSVKEIEHVMNVGDKNRSVGLVYFFVLYFVSIWFLLSYIFCFIGCVFEPVFLQ